ncbi:MAG: hypothetical protein HYV90_00725 [Candidatus Woesebacteria bacterium]|nr:MAG: hypothetical protein HYV90_00725 [Candidatus Woesebacteria bacterium]
MKRSRTIDIFLLISVGVLIRFGLFKLLGEEINTFTRLFGTVSILVVGALVLKGCAEVIEETTDILSRRTKLAGGFLQSIGTAFPDMAIGIVAALVSLQLRHTDYALAVSFAIIAAATTFGSNIYNIAHAAWCIFRQNLANNLNRDVLMFPPFVKGGTVRPLKNHIAKPTSKEIDTSIDILNALTIITAIVAISMVLFGKVASPPEGMAGDLYQLIRPVGFVVFFLSALVVFYFRKTQRAITSDEERVHEKMYYSGKSNLLISSHLILSGVSILLAAESMVHAVQVFCEITNLPTVVAGVFAGLIGCLGEMLVVHNYSISPKGRIADAIVGVGMDNIVTTIGASIVAIMGGIFLGGNALILIFVIILALNTSLIWQISRLKNFL